jgi:hypothetical protein
MKCLAKVGIPLNPSFVGTSLYWMKHLTFIISGSVYHFANGMWNILSVSLFAADPDLMAVGYNDKHTGWQFLVIQPKLLSDTMTSMLGGNSSPSKKVF